MADATQNARALKAERNRFLGFAFASADLLVEVNDLLHMNFITGAAADLTGHKPDALLGLPLTDLFEERERGYLIAAISRLEFGRRLQPITIKLLRADHSLVDVIVGGFQMETGTYLSISRADRLWPQNRMPGSRSDETGLMNKEAYIKAMADRLSSLSDEERQVTLFVIDGLESLRDTADPKSVQAFLEDIGNMVRAMSLGGDSAGQLSPHDLSLMHNADNAAEIAALEARIQEKAAEAGLGQIKIKKFNLDLDITGLSDDDAAKALTYALQKFSDTPMAADFKITNLAEASQSYLADTVGRLNVMRASMAPEKVNIAFQPVVKLDTREAWYYESAVQLEGFNSPKEMLAFAEQIGVIEDFDLLVLDKILEQLRIKARHSFHPKIALNVNVLSLASPLFLGSLRNHIKQAGSVGRQVAIEINDAASITDLARLDNVVQKLREDGNPVAIDNVGVGKTLDILREVKVDYAKLAPSLVSGFLTNPKQEGLLKSMIATCRSLKYVMVAEGVTDEDEARTLKSLGVQYGQGTLFGKPSTGGQALSYRPSDRSMNKRGVSVTW